MGTRERGWEKCQVTLQWPVQALTFHSGPQPPGQGPRLRPRAGDGAECPQVGQEQEEQKTGSSQDLERVPKVNLKKASSGARSKGQEEGCGWERTRWPWNAVGAGRARNGGLECLHRTWGGASWEGVVRRGAQDQDSHLVRDQSTLVVFLETKRHKEAQAPGRGALGTNARWARLCPQHCARTNSPRQLLPEKRPCQ